MTISVADYIKLAGFLLLMLGTGWAFGWQFLTVKRIAESATD